MIFHAAFTWFSCDSHMSFSLAALCFSAEWWTDKKVIERIFVAKPSRSFNPGPFVCGKMSQKKQTKVIFNWIFICLLACLCAGAPGGQKLYLPKRTKFLFVDLASSSRFRMRLWNARLSTVRSMQRLLRPHFCIQLAKYLLDDRWSLRLCKSRIETPCRWRRARRERGRARRERETTRIYPAKSSSRPSCSLVIERCSSPLVKGIIKNVFASI